jgi:hypothetical protein
MARPVGSKNKQSDETSETTLLYLIAALMANPNIYPKHSDQAIIAMAKRMIEEIDK